MSRRRAEEALANADLAGPLGDGREHDVHDPDPADDEADPGDRSQDDVEDIPDLVRLLEQFQRHDDVVVPPRMAPLECLPHNFSGGDDVVRRLEPHRDLIVHDRLRPKLPAVKLV